MKIATRNAVTEVFIKEKSIRENFVEESLLFKINSGFSEICCLKFFKILIKMLAVFFSAS